MTTFIDTYISSPDRGVLDVFLSSFVNYIQPVQGTAMTEDQPAKGDPALWYSCVRATADITPIVSAPIAVVDATTGSMVIGIWAG